MTRKNIRLKIAEYLSDYDRTTIEKYWETEEKTTRYKNAIQWVARRANYSDIDKFENYLARHSFVIITDERMRCIYCDQQVTARTRKELDDAIAKGFNSELYCKDCTNILGFSSEVNFKKDVNVSINKTAKDLSSKRKSVKDANISVNEIAKNVIEDIEDIIRFKYSFLFIKSDLNLTYLEKIYLYLIALKCQVNEFGKLNKEIWQDMFITERADKNFLIKSLYEKRVIFNTKKNDEIIKIINENSKFFLKKSHLIDLEFRNKYQKYRYLFLEENTFLNFVMWF